MLRVHRPGERWTSYRYDGTGHVLSEEYSDGSETFFWYNLDGLLMEAGNSEMHITFNRDRACRIIGETQGEYSLQRTYDEAGNCIWLKSSLGADLAFDYDKQGNLESIKSGDQWHADWQRDRQGLELHRSLSGGISVRTERDRFGREIQKSVGYITLKRAVINTTGVSETA